MTNSSKVLPNTTLNLARHIGASRLVVRMLALRYVSKIKNNEICGKYS